MVFGGYVIGYLHNQIMKFCASGMKITSLVGQNPKAWVLWTQGVWQNLFGLIP